MSILYILNRSIEKSLDLSIKMRKFFITAKIKVLPLNDVSLKFISKTYLVVNCTSLGLLNSGENFFNKIEFSNNQIVYDLVYRKQITFFLKKAKKAGAKTYNGLGMLLYQGIRSFEIWTGKKAPIEIMTKSLYEKKSFK